MQYLDVAKARSTPGITPLDQLWCRIRFRQARYEGVFTPPGLSAFIQYPGFVGGSSWGSVAIDPERHVMIINATRFANYGRLLYRAEADAKGMKPFRGDAVHGGSGEIGITRPQIGTPFAIEHDPFLSPLGVPCQQPPFGTIAAGGNILLGGPSGDTLIATACHDPHDPRGVRKDPCTLSRHMSVKCRSDRRTAG